MGCSLVTSVRNPDVEKIQDPAWEEWFETDEEKEGARASWIYIKKRVDAGAQEQINDATYDAVLKARRDNPMLQDLETKVSLGTGMIITTAVMALQFEGPLFEDPDTGRPLAMSGTMEDRLNVARRLPLAVVQFVDAEVGKRNLSPLRTPSTDDGTKKGSGRSSTRTSKQEKTD